ncbi:MAG: hypothetical protein GY870_07995 [archaeon]|nr:hypothetical protein [archaeon]
MTNEDELKALNKKMDQVLNVLRDFGLSIIENIGGLKHNLGVITDQVEEVNRSLIYIKGLGVKIEELSNVKNEVSSELKYIQSLIKAGLIQKPPVDEKIEVSKDLEEAPETILNFLSERITNINNINDLISEIGNVKEKIFTITGGHRVLHEINSEINNLKKEKEISQELIQKIKEKIQFWINKF